MGICVAVAGCALRRTVDSRVGIPGCSTAAARDLLSDEALQCWLPATHGAWRMLLHESHYDSLVVYVAVDALRDAEEIATRLIENQPALLELLLYAQRQGGESTSTRRVRWTRLRGYESLEF